MGKRDVIVPDGSNMIWLSKIANTSVSDERRAVARLEKRINNLKWHNRVFPPDLMLDRRSLGDILRMLKDGLSRTDPLSGGLFGGPRDTLKDLIEVTEGMISDMENGELVEGTVPEVVEYSRQMMDVHRRSASKKLVSEEYLREVREWQAEYEERGREDSEMADSFDEGDTDAYEFEVGAEMNWDRARKLRQRGDAIEEIMKINRQIDKIDFPGPEMAELIRRRSEIEGRLLELSK